jgi:hypothetical protein
VHAGSFEYATKHFGGGKTILIKINPKNIVSVPTDYNGGKMRVCEFYVVSEYKGTQPLTQQEVLQKGHITQLCSTDPVQAPQEAVEVSTKVYASSVTPSTKYDSLGRPIPKRDQFGRFIKN